MSDFLDFLYERGNQELEQVLGDDYKPEGPFKHGADVVVARLPKESGDGLAVVIHECRMPARFYSIEAEPGADSMGRPKAGYRIGTGSGGDGRMEKWVVDTARLITTGMIGFHVGAKE